MRAAALQFDVTDSVERNLATVLPWLERAAERGLNLVVLPEMWASSFPRTREIAPERIEADRRAAETLREASERLGLCIAGSAMALEGDQLRNRLQVFDAGVEILNYDKIHLFSPTAEQEIFGAGGLPPATVDSSVGKLCGAVCYDLRFPEMFRLAHRAGVEVFVLPAQWPAPRASHWKSLVVARAIENQCYVIAANRTGTDEIGRRKLLLEFPGNSLVVTPHGSVLAEGDGTEGLVEAALDPQVARNYRTRVPVEKDERPDLYKGWL